jgi:hypothetical protein
MADHARRTGPAVEAHFQSMQWLIPAVERFPRAQKFLLGDRIQTTALDVLEALIEATYARDRKAHLARANLGLEKLRPPMAKQQDDLFHRIANFRALKAAAMKAILGKRKKPGAAAFCANLEPELLRLECSLLDGSYRPGRYVTITIREPKERFVSAAPFRDRVVHHALCAVVCPIFEAGFIANSYANRTGKGTHRAITAYEGYRDRHTYVLRCDVFRYFPAIDHAILKRRFRRRIACSETLALLD